MSSRRKREEGRSRSRSPRRHEKSSKREREVDGSSKKMRAWDLAEGTLGGELQKEERGGGRGGRGGKVENENKRGSDGAAAGESSFTSSTQSCESRVGLKSWFFSALVQSNQPLVLTTS